MRKLIAFCHLSLDGIASIQSGALDWISYDQDLEKWAEVIVVNTDTAIYGRNTFELMKYWQTVPSDPNATIHELNHAKWIENVEKIVITKTLNSSDWNNTRIIHDNVKDEILKLKQNVGKNITIFGSPTLIRSLLNIHLIDEFQLSVHPVLLGTEKTLFEGLDKKIKLNLVEENTFKSGAITLHYIVE